MPCAWLRNNFLPPSEKSLRNASPCPGNYKVPIVTICEIVIIIIIMSKCTVAAVEFCLRLKCTPQSGTRVVIAHGLIYRVLIIWVPIRVLYICRAEFNPCINMYDMDNAILYRCLFAVACIGTCSTSDDDDNIIIIIVYIYTQSIHVYMQCTYIL